MGEISHQCFPKRELKRQQAREKISLFPERKGTTVAEGDNHSN